MKKFWVIISALALFDANCKDVQRKSYQNKIQKKRRAVHKKVGLPDAKQAILIDFDTDEVLYEKNPEERCAPSSMTKLMTLYLLFSSIRDGFIKKDDEFFVSKAAQRMEGSRSFLEAGTRVKIENLIRSIIVHSGNDACIVVAEGLSGDTNIFVEEMNRKAIEFGLTNTHFTNPTGLSNKDHYSTVHDLAIIAKRLMKDFPEYYHYFSEKVFTISGITQRNRNALLGNSLNVDGLKTGHTDAGGFGLVASTIRNGKRLISVVNGCSSEKSRCVASNNLLILGYREFSNLKAIQAGIPVEKLKIWLGDKQEIDVCTHEDIDIMIPRRFLSELKIEAKMKEPLEAPVSLGAKVGELSYRYGNFVSKKYDLFACQEVRKANFFEYLKFLINYHLLRSFQDNQIREVAG